MVKCNQMTSLPFKGLTYFGVWSYTFTERNHTAQKFGISHGYCDRKALADIATASVTGGL